MSPLPAKVKRGITPEQKKESEIKLGLPFKVPDFVCKFQMIFFRRTEVIQNVVRC
jgi:hypothetical protein